MALETELKVRVSEKRFLRIRELLQNKGGTVKTPSATEVNILFDTPDQKLRQSGCALRLRSYAGQHFLTFKGPVMEHPVLKQRPEFQTDIGAPSAMQEILAGLGLKPHFIYSKKREVHLWKFRDKPLEVCFDQTPLGFFVEIEGEETRVREAAHEVGIDDSEAIRKSYVTLYAEAGLGGVSG